MMLERRASPPAAVQQRLVTLSSASHSTATLDGADSPLLTAGFWALTVGSVGIVYGDIGTSPLYAFREAMLAASEDGHGVSEGNVLGVLSLIFWSLIIVVTLKYVLILTRADNRGEGGTLALMALAQESFKKAAPVIVVFGAVAASLFYGDAMITPALSVLSAIEGLEVVEPLLQPAILPLTVVILMALFAVQSRGTHRVAAFFGPITTVWFVALAVPGIVAIVGDPAVLHGLNPLHAVRFLFTHGIISFVTLGAVFLAVTGAEALYADLGHFGRKPIQVAWLGLVLPALVINYFGQGALVLARPDAVDSPFFLLYPDWARLPMVVLATAATVIASQAVITGAYSLSRQAVQLGLLPRLEVRHTSEAHPGQIYVPRVNAFLLIGVLLLVGLFRSSSALAGAYGIAVTGTMVVTALLAFIVIWRSWHWHPVAAAALVAPFLLIDCTFLSANLLKVLSGGWFPLLLGGFLLLVMLTWRRGSALLLEKSRRTEVPLAELVDRLEAKPPPRIAGTAIFLTSDPVSTPTALLHSLKHFHVLHENNAILTLVMDDRPRVPSKERVTIEHLSASFLRITVRYGFTETPNLPRTLTRIKDEAFTYDVMKTTFFLSRRSLKASKKSGMPLWQDKIFLPLARNADDASSYFGLPTDRVVEIGTQVTI
jgi:KUP system potassium uptake protein